jgi:hypothetical protein
MPPTYSATPTNLHPAKLDDRALLAIGRLVRACAEMEDLVNLFICNLAGISESQMVVLMGRSAITRRVEIAEYLAKMKGPGATKLADWAFNPGFWETLQVRNAVAHGVLLGLTDEGTWSFLTSKIEPPTGDAASLVVASYSTPYLEALGAAAEASIPLLEKHLQLETQRAARQGKPLSPHRKAQPQRKPSAKRARQPRPSRGSPKK